MLLTASEGLKQMLFGSECEGAGSFYQIRSGFRNSMGFALCERINNPTDRFETDNE